MERRDRYLIAAVIVGPLAVFPAMLIGESLLWISVPASPPDLIEQSYGAGIIAALGLVYAYPLTVVYGVPVFLILRWYQLDHLWMVVGIAMAPVAVIWAGYGYNVEVLLFAGYFAAWVSGACWLVAVWLPARRSPNRLGMAKIKRSGRNVLLIAALPALMGVVFVAFNEVPRYLSWRNLGADELRKDALRYSNGQPVCLYVADCSTDVARLKLIRNEADLDIDKLKNIFWRRRFDGYCKGYTEDIVIDIPHDLPTKGPKDDARWSFYNNRFITNHGHFQGSAGSFYPYEKCTVNNTLWGRTDH